MDDLVRDSTLVQNLTLQSISAESGSGMPLLLALDQGGHASRALVFDIQGRQITQAFAPIATHRVSEDRVEHDADEVLESLRIVIADVAHTLGDDVKRLHAAGLATQRSSVVCWQSNTGKPLSPVLSWQDRRNAALINQLQPHRNDIQQLTGLVLTPHYGASKIRWCLEQLPEVQQAYAQHQLQCGPLASFLLRGLLDEHPQLVDPANASRTQLWSPATRDWSSQLLQLFDIPREVLPRSVPTCHRYGSLRVGAQRIPLQVCTGDQAAVPFAVGALRDDAVYLNLGTGAFVLAPLQNDVTDTAPMLRSVLYSDEAEVRYALEGTVNGAGNALQWLNERVGIDIERAIPVLQRSQLQHLQIPLFINGVGGVGSPYWLPHVNSRFISSPTTQDSQIGRANNVSAHTMNDDLAKLAAVVESIAFLLTDNIALLRKQLPQLDHIIAGGGLSACRYLGECIATLTGLPLFRIQEPELTAKGLAYLLAKAVNRPEEWLINNTSIQFAVEHVPALQARYHAWRQIMQDLPAT